MTQPAKEDTGRIAGVDYGTVRIGVAISDPGRTLASPLAQHTRGGLEADTRFFKKLVKEEGVARFVVGLPVHVSGHESAKSLEARRFGAWLTEITGVPVEFFDERYTSVQAEDFLLAAELTSKKRKQRRDMLAAQILLAGYLEAGRSRQQCDAEPLED